MKLKTTIQGSLLVMVLGIVINFSLISCNEGSDDDDDDATGSPTAASSMTMTPTAQDGTPTPTPTPDATNTQTPDESLDGHWIGDVYLGEFIGPCQIIDFWVNGPSVTGFIYWTVGPGDPDLNVSCDEDANGYPVTWQRQDFSANIDENTFEWTQGNYDFPESIDGFFQSNSLAFGYWIRHSDETHYNFGSWRADKQNE